MKVNTKRIEYLLEFIDALGDMDFSKKKSPSYSSTLEGL